MVRRVNSRMQKALAGLLLFLAFGGVLWHVLACRESPMAFSPDGKRLALVIMEPYKVDDFAKEGGAIFRLMVLTDGKDLKLVEQTNACMLSGPAFSPDGKQLCYVRLPLNKPETPAAQPAADIELGAEDHTLPDAAAQMKLKNGPVQDAALVVCDAESFKEVHQVGIKLLAPAEPGMNYVIERPQYSPDGQWIYLCAGQQLIRVNPREPKQETLAVPAYIARLSPDGKNVAFLSEKSLGIRRTDGEVAIFRRWDADQPSLCGLTWKDNQTVAVLSQPSDDEKRGALHLFRTDGSWVSSSPVNLPGDSGEGNTGDLAISPDGRRMVVSYGHTVLFMDAEGNVQSTWKTKDEGKDPGKEGWLVQPSFTPDSKQVAFKLLAGDGDEIRTKAIVFFNAEGKETSRVLIPASPRADKPGPL